MTETSRESAIPAGWTRHEPGPCPVPPETVVEVMFTDYRISTLPNPAFAYHWGLGDIIAYRIVEPAPSPPASIGGGVRVKALEWADRGDGLVFSAETVVGTYLATLEGCWFPPDGSAMFPKICTLASAKAAAQADYSARILAAIEPSTTDHERVIADLRAENERLRKSLRAIFPYAKRLAWSSSEPYHEDIREADAALKGSK